MPSPFPDLPPDQRGRVRVLRHSSTALAGNPWGDPAERDVHVYLPPAYDSGFTYPAILVLAPFAGTGAGLLGRGLTDIPLSTRIDRLIAEAGCPPFVAVMPDVMTSVGGSQFLDSPGLGRYQTWIAEELPSFIADHVSLDGRWGAVGRSSGGFGALRLAMDRPGLLAAVACHAGDMGFDLTYLPEIRGAVMGLQRHGGLEGFVETFWSRHRPDGHAFAALNVLAMSCAYAGDPEASPYPCRLPFDVETGALDWPAFEAWLPHDPVHRVHHDGVAAALAGLDLLHLDAGESDEYGLHLSLRRLVRKLEDLEIPHVHEEHPGGHRGTSFRYDVSLPALARALVEGR
jgi:enterochelin esterase-like enzyme